MSRRPEVAPRDHRYQDQINKSWDPKLQRGDLFWVFNEKTGKIWGPYNFSHYTHLGAVGWVKTYCTQSIKVRYSKGEIVCGTELIALERQFIHKAFEYAKTQGLADTLRAEVEALNEKLKEIRGGTTDQTGEL